MSAEALVDYVRGTVKLNCVGVGGCLDVRKAYVQACVARLVFKKKLAFLTSLALRVQTSPALHVAVLPIAGQPVHWHTGLL